MPSPLPKTPSHSALVGILWSVLRAGEKPTVRAAGSACWPFEPEGPARVNLDLILHAVHVAGCEVPDHFHFHAGQVFYRDDRPEEIRLAGVIPGESDTTGQPTFTPWGTPTLPTVTTGPNNTLILDPAPTVRLDPAPAAALQPATPWSAWTFSELFHKSNLLREYHLRLSKSV